MMPSPTSVDPLRSQLALSEAVAGPDVLRGRAPVQGGALLS